MAQFKERHVWSKVEPVIDDALRAYIEEKRNGEPLDMSKVVRQALVLFLIQEGALDKDILIRAVA